MASSAEISRNYSEKIFRQPLNLQTNTDCLPLDNNAIIFAKDSNPGVAGLIILAQPEYPIMRFSNPKNPVPYCTPEKIRSVYRELSSGDRDGTILIGKSYVITYVASDYSAVYLNLLSARPVKLERVDLSLDLRELLRQRHDTG